MTPPGARPDANAQNPSAFFRVHEDRLGAAALSGPVLDLACGRGRHALACAAQGMQTIGLDRNPAHLAALRSAAQADPATRDRLTCVRSDVEAGPSLPFRSGSCGAILVFRFLCRPLSAAIIDALVPGGLLLYETFTLEQRSLGFGPKRDAFLLAAGELPHLFEGLEVLAYEEGLSDEPTPSATARLLARKP